jgi:hypothetical protein
MANEVINPADQPVYQAGVLAERKRINEALRRIAGRYQEQRHADFQVSELVIRRAIEEIFDGPLPWVDESEVKPKGRR